MSNGKKAVLTGATGYIGMNLLKRLIEDEYEVHLLTRNSSNRDSLASFEDKASIHRYDGDLDHLLELFNKIKPEVIFHLASKVQATHDVDDVDDIISSNILFSTTPYSIDYFVALFPKPYKI